MKPSSLITVQEFFKSRISELEMEGRWGTASNYEKAERSFMRFCGDRVVRLRDITPELVERYNRYLQDRGVIRNSISQYNRVLRAVYNKAVSRNLVKNLHPFYNVYTGIDRTSKRALTENELARIAAVKTENSLLELARDMFLFSYATCGMPFVDMVYLKKKDISDNTIIYYRRKTGTRIEVGIEPLVKKIIDKYSAISEDSEYVFPILGNLSGRDAYKRFVSALSEYNRALRKISSVAGTACVSSYVPRHSWATAARNNGADVSTISEALGHHSERTTIIYLGSFDRTRIEKVNRKLVDQLKMSGSVLYKKRLLMNKIFSINRMAKRVIIRINVEKTIHPHTIL